MEEISGVAFIFNQKFFNDLNEAKGISLENIVYYKVGNKIMKPTQLIRFVQPQISESLITAIHAMDNPIRPLSRFLWERRVWGFTQTFDIVQRPRGSRPS